MSCRRLLVDTNIGIDYVRRREPFYEKARLLMMLGCLRELELWVGMSQTSDLFYALSDGGRKSRAEEAKRDMRQLRRFLHVCSMGEQELDAAIDSSWSDVEDACVYQAALKIRADAIVTRNQADFAKSTLRVFDCDGLFAYLEAEEGFAYDEIGL